MTASFDLTDVPKVPGSDLAALIEILLATGQTSVLFKGYDAAARAPIEALFWKRFQRSAADGTAVLLRFWALVDALGSRRLAKLLMNEGFMVLEPLMLAASELRLNASWGFAPQRVLWAVSHHQKTLQANRTVETRGVVLRPSRLGGMGLVESQIAA